MNMCFTLLSCNKLIHIITHGGIKELKKETKEMIDETIELPEKKSCSCFTLIVKVNNREEETEMSECTVLRLGMSTPHFGVGDCYARPPYPNSLPIPDPIPLGFFSSPLPARGTGIPWVFG